MTDEEAYERAKERVEEIRGFYAHVLIFVLVNLALLILNLATRRQTDGVLWFVWPLLGWSIALAAHAICVFGVGPFLNHTWEERRIRQELERQQHPAPHD